MFARQDKIKRLQQELDELKREVKQQKEEEKFAKLANRFLDLLSSKNLCVEFRTQPEIDKKLLERVLNIDFNLLIEQKNELSMLIENPETYIPDVELLMGVLTLLDAVHDFAEAHQNIR